MSNKPHSFSVYNLAKDLMRLPNSEKKAITIIADHIRKPEGYCNAALETLAKESGASIRHIRYGIHGRQKEDGTKYNAGLLERGLIYIDQQISSDKGGRSKPAVYRVSLENWLDYLPEDRRQEVEDLLENAAQRRHKGGTSDDERRHNSENDALVSRLDPSIPGTKAANVPTKPLKKENQEIETSTPSAEDGLTRFRRIQVTHLGIDWPCGTSKEDRSAVESLEKRFGEATVDLAFAIFIHHEANTYQPNGDKITHLVGYFAHKSGAAIPFCEQVKPWSDAGFTSAYTVLELQNTCYIEKPELTTICPADARRIESLGGKLVKEYKDFYEHNRLGTLKDFISYLDRKAFEKAEVA